MATTVNIRRDVTDPFYRYKMEKLQSKIEGKGNGIKTVIANLSSVSHSLAREPAHLIKYFGFELGAQTNTNPADDRWIINGAHEAAKLQDYLDGFINKFVLCKKCKNPETDMSFPEGRIVLKCKACGERTDADQRHKLSSFILKSVPKKGKKDKSTKKAERKARKEREQQDGEDGSNGSHDSNDDNGDDNGDDEGLDAGSDDELTRRINSEAKNIEVEEQDVEWSVDTSAAAVAARAQQLPDDLKAKLTVNGDEDRDGGNAGYEQLGEWIAEQGKEKGGVSKITSVDIYLKAKELGIDEKHRTLTVLAQTLFDADINEKDQIDSRAGMLKKLINGSEKHEKAFLGGTERLIGLTYPEQLNNEKGVGKILYSYFENKIVTEEGLRSFFGKASKKYTADVKVSKEVCKNAQPFIKYLDTRESSEEEDEEDEDEDESE